MSNTMNPLEMADFLRGIAHLHATDEPLDHEEVEMLRAIADWIDEEGITPEVREQYNDWPITSEDEPSD